MSFIVVGSLNGCALPCPTSMTLLFPRRIIRFLLSLIYAAFFAWATWMSAFVFEFNDEDRLYQVLFCLAFAAHGCWLGARHARYVFRRESVHLDADGITLWHNDVRQWRALRLPWADVLDVWTDNIRLYRAEARLCLVWRDGKRVENVALRLPPGLYRLSNGKRCRNQAAAALLAQLIARHRWRNRPCLPMSAGAGYFPISTGFSMASPPLCSPC